MNILYHDKCRRTIDKQKNKPLKAKDGRLTVVYFFVGSQYMVKNCLEASLDNIYYSMLGLKAQQKNKLSLGVGESSF